MADPNLPGKNSNTHEVPISTASGASSKIKVSKNGPYIVSGKVSLVKEVEGKEEAYPEQEHYALCRCGHSKNKPFCDGSHITSGFNDTL